RGEPEQGGDLATPALALDRQFHPDRPGRLRPAAGHPALSGRGDRSGDPTSPDHGIDWKRILRPGRRSRRSGLSLTVIRIVSGSSRTEFLAGVRRAQGRMIVKILDKQRYWAFTKAYVICYVSLVGLYVVIDAFANLDEFYKRAEGVELFRIMGRYYLVHQSQFFDQLCGVIGMMAAIFTVTWMQRNNEQLAMLAAGISTHRAIIPVLVSSVIVSLFAVANQEMVMPYFGEELARRHDDDGFQQVNLVSTRYDARNIMMHGKSADRATRTSMRYYATIPLSVLGKIHDIIGSQATYIPPDHPTAPLKGGWLIREATINPPLDQDELQDSEAILTRVN